MQNHDKAASRRNEPRRPRRVSVFRLESLEGRALMAQVVEYPVGTNPNLVNSLYGITAGPDGNVWFTDSAGDAIGKITPEGVVTEFPVEAPAGDVINGITRAADGSLVFTESQDSLGRMTTGGQVTQIPIDPTGQALDQVPTAITTAPDGSIWWVDSGLAAVGELTAGGVVHVYELPMPTQAAFGLSGLNAIAIGPDGNIWATDSSNQGDFIDKITASGQITTYSLPGGTGPSGIVAGPDGNLWVTEGGSDSIAVVSTSGQVLHTYQVPGGGGALQSITLGSDNNLYFTEELGNIGEITVAGTVTVIPDATTVPPLSPGLTPRPLAITSGPDGNIWFTDPNTGSIGELKIVTGSPTPTGPTKPTGPTSPTTPTTPTTPTSPTTPTGTKSPPRTPLPAASPLPPGYARTPPHIVGLIAKRARNGQRSIVLTLDQPVSAKPLLRSSEFTLEGQGADEAFDERIRITQVVYNRRTHTITLALARRPKINGTVQLRVAAAGVVNLMGQHLIGNEGGAPGDDFESLIDLR